MLRGQLGAVHPGCSSSAKVSQSCNRCGRFSLRTRAAFGAKSLRAGFRTRPSCKAQQGKERSEVYSHESELGLRERGKPPQVRHYSEAFRQLYASSQLVKQGCQHLLADSLSFLHQALHYLYGKFVSVASADHLACLRDLPASLQVSSMYELRNKSLMQAQSMIW